MSDRPNILLIMSDQHNPYVMGCAGDEVVRTPNLDGLASRGVRFENCYCPSPLCVPSRMSFMSARTPSHNQVWTNQCSLSSNAPTFAHSLGAAGYEVVLGGRMHFVGPDQRHGFEQRIGGQISPTYVGSRNRAIPAELFPGAGQSRPAVEISGPGRQGYQAYDEVVTEACVDFLLNKAGADRPFCLVAGFVLPHCPFICPEEEWDYYIDRVTLPEIPAGYFDSLHPAMQLWRRNRGIADVSEDSIRRARAGYYGLVTHIDRLIGELLEAVEETGLAEDTIIIYTSDHGEMAGDHGLWWKSNFYEGSASVPLIASWPGRIPEGARPSHVTNLMDLGPTMIDLAGAEPLPDVDGRSLAPVLRGEDCDWTDETFSEHYPSGGVPPTRMIRSGPWKLVHFEGYRPQLFNVEEDPGEWIDLAESPEHSDIREELHARCLEGWSAAHMQESLAQRGRGNQVLAKWCQAVQPEVPEQWVAGEDDNIYPDARVVGP